MATGTQQNFASTRFPAVRGTPRSANTRPPNRASGSPLGKTLLGLVLGIGVLLLLAPPLTVTVGGLAYPILVLQARPQRTCHRGQRSPQPAQSQVLTYAYRMLEGALQV